MNSNALNLSEYQGFEQGPIRPPSEAASLLIRVTRNCPWNRCTFCPVYKDAQFSVRRVDHVLADIDAVHRHVAKLRQISTESRHGLRREILSGAQNSAPEDSQAFSAALHWARGGMQSVFIQDANSLIIKPADLKKILLHLRDRFPWLERITSYARSHTIARIKDEDLKALRDAGLNRIHIGLESGSDQVLEMVKKGSDKQTHIKAGVKVKAAGMQLSEYVMPGLGGRALSDIHALETADALNQINPDFIRLRTLALPAGVDLFKACQDGRFEKCTDLMMAKEILTFIEHLDGITSMIKSDHILNLFEDVAGQLPQDKSRISGILKNFIELDPQRQCVYQVGRRLGLFDGLSDMQNPHRLAKAESACRQLGITPENVDQMVDEMMRRFI